MADAEDELSDFEDLKLPDDDFPAVESEADAAPSSGPESEPPSPPEPQPEAKDAVKGRTKGQRWASEAEAKAAKTKVKKRREKQEQPSEKTGRLLKSLTHASPYTVMLGMALLALLIAVFCLLLELGRYGFHVKASADRQGALLGTPAQSAPASTIAAA